MGAKLFFHFELFLMCFWTLTNIQFISLSLSFGARFISTLRGKLNTVTDKFPFAQCIAVTDMVLFGLILKTHFNPLHHRL